MAPIEEEKVDIQMINRDIKNEEGKPSDLQIRTALSHGDELDFVEQNKILQSARKDKEN